MKNVFKTRNSAIENRKLISVTFEITYRCNWRCIHCYIDDYYEDYLSLERIYELLTELKEFGVENILFTGGEVFMRPDFMDIIKYARDLGFYVSIFSNISLLTDEIIEKLMLYNVKDISCTLFSLNPDVHDRITGVKGSFQKAFSNIIKLKALNFCLEVKTIVLKDNAGDYLELLDFLEKNNIEHRSSSLLSVKNSGNNCNKICELSIFENKKLLPLLDKINQVNIPKSNIELNDYICHEVRYSLSIGPRGEIYSCLNFRKIIGHIDDGISNIWNSKLLNTIQEYRVKDLKICNKCGLQKFCVRCTGTAYLEKGDILGCSTSDKAFAITRKEIEDEKVFKAN